MKAKLSVFLFVLLVFFAGWIIGKSNTGVPSASGNLVNAKQLASMMKTKNFTLINVHTPYDGEIPKTDTFIPYDQIVANSASLPKDKKAPIILYCRSGNMSTQAIATLQKLGYTNVWHLDGGMDAWKKNGGQLLDLATLEEQVIPKDGVNLPVSWGDLPRRLVAAGVIDEQKFVQALNLTDDGKNLLKTESTAKIHVDKTNAQFVVDMLWAIGLAQKSIVYTQGPMGTSEKANAGKFASTGGWTLARGDAMHYYNTMDLIPLTDAQQRKVAEIAKNVYRPCCGNSTWFPDCNHGMAALAAIEMMVSANIDEKTIYRNVLSLNSYWFSDTYLATATFFARQGTPWDKVDPKEMLGAKYSSGGGAQEIAAKVGPLPYKPENTGGSCGA